MKEVKHITAREIVVKFFDKEYEKLSLEELCRAPLSAISGISESDAAVLKRARATRLSVVSHIRAFSKKLYYVT